MKIVKPVFFFLIVLCGVFTSYLAYLAYETQGWTTTGFYLILSLLLLCFGTVSLLLTINKNPRISTDSIYVNPASNLNLKAATMSTDSEVVSKDIVTTAIEISAPIIDEVRVDPIDIKEDPIFLFGDWYVDQDGLYIDLPLIKITGRKQQRTLRKLDVKTKLDYHIKDTKDEIEIMHDKIVLGLVPEIYLHSILMYVQGVDQFYVETIEKKGRDIVRFIVRVRFSDELREKLQKKLQQKNWRQ